METNSDSRAEFASKILQQLLGDYFEETQAVCKELNYKIEELSPVAPESFASKGVTSDFKDIRFAHHEARRITKVLKIAAEVVKKLNSSSYSSLSSLKSLVLGANNLKLSRKSSIAQSVRSGSYSAFTRPQDFIHFGLEKENEKFHRSVKALERISFLRDEAKLKADLKTKQFQEKDKIVTENRLKKENEFQRTVSSNIEKRKKILEKKYEIRKSIDVIMADYGVELEKRMKKLSEAQKVEIREELKRKEKRLKEKLRSEKKKQEAEQKKVFEESMNAGEMLKTIHNKISARVNEYLQMVQTRVQSAREHFVKVGNTLKSCLRVEAMNQTANIRNCVNKSLLSSKKIKVKHRLASESSEKLQKMMSQSFQSHKRGISEITSAEQRRQARILERVNAKQQTFQSIQKGIMKKYQEKKQQNFLRMEVHFRSYLEKQRLDMLNKQKVLEKHKRLSRIADQLNEYKDEVSYNKRRNNLAVQRIRSSRGSPAARLSFSNTKNF